MHPGWSDTPGVVKSMPDFHKTFEKKLRTPYEGADTIFWLASSKNVNKKEHNGQFFRDRNIEIKHLWLTSTKYDKLEAEKLWNWCCDLTNWKI